MSIIDRHVLETKILGESVRLSSDVSEERLREISECISEKVAEIQKFKRGLTVSTSLFKLLVNVNLADDLISVREQLAEQISKNTELEKRISEQKSKNAELEKGFSEQRSKNAELEKGLSEQRSKNIALEKEIAKLRRELREYGNQSERKC